MARNPEKAKAAAKARYQKNRERILASNARSRAKHHEKIKAQKRAAHHAKKDDPEYQAKRRAQREARKDVKREYDRQRHIREREARIAKAIAWRKANPEAVRAITFNYDAKRRSQKRGGVTAGQVRRWVAEQPKICRWCRADCSEKFHVDHVVPLAKGGAHELSNFAIACPPCNIRKNAKEPERFLAEIAA